MQNYIFYGSVLPERVNIYIPQTNANIPEAGIDISLECVRSKIIAKCSCNDPTINPQILKNYVETTSRVIVDAIGYTVACGYDVEIESVYNLNTNEFYILGVHEEIFDDPQINENTNRGIPHPDIPISTNELAKIAGINPELQIALGDFREAIRQPNFTSFHCYRAIEALRHAFTFCGEEESNQWKELRTNLLVDRDDIDIIKKHADFLRHGKSIPQPWKIRKKHMLITWEIIKKYIDWRIKNLVKNP
jgi:hypothetical protein